MTSIEGFYGIIGLPLTHSLSPFLHSTSFKALNLSALMRPLEIRPDQLSDFFNAFRLLNLRGCCVTLPHKTAVLDHVDAIDENARRVGAANTLFWQHGQLQATNTDVDGFLAPLMKQPIARDQPILILGAGGAARAVIVGLQQLGCTNLFISNRTFKKATDLAAEFQLCAIKWENRHQLETRFIINTTALGLLHHAQHETPYEKIFFNHNGGLAYDLVYQPLVTRFLSEAQESGWKIITGFDMFIGQAQKQHQLFVHHSLAPSAIFATKNRLIDHYKSGTS